MRVALLELGGSHEECLYTQLEALRTLQQCEVMLISTPALLKRYAAVEMFDATHAVQVGKGSKSWKTLWNLNGFLRKQQLDLLVFNTAQGGIIKRLCVLPNFPKIPVYGLLHDLRKLSTSFGQRFISHRIKRYFVLADYLKLQAPDEWKPKLSTFYPISFPAILHEYDSASSRNATTLSLVVPGQVSIARRDYFGLLNMLSKADLKETKVYFLGRSAHAHGDGAALRMEIKRLGLEKHIKLWDDFISDEEFEVTLSLADYVMPLIHPGHISASLYEYQITGAFNQAYGHRKTMLMHEHWKKNADFEDTALFYTEESFSDLLEQLKKEKLNADYRLEKWDVGYQYREFLLGLGLLP